MYFEETDWCRRAADIGWLTHYLPGARLIHFEGKSSEQVIAARTIRFQRSKLRYAQKYFGSIWTAVLRSFLWITFALQWLEETVKWLLGHKRSLRKQRMVAWSTNTFDFGFLCKATPNRERQFHPSFPLLTSSMNCLSDWGVSSP